MQLQPGITKHVISMTKQTGSPKDTFCSREGHKIINFYYLVLIYINVKAVDKEIVVEEKSVGNHHYSLTVPLLGFYI